MEEPVVSVILPTFNRSAVLSDSIASVLRQSYRNFELIIVDDGSTDTTRELVSGLRDDRVVYIRRESNEGAASARNLGIGSARGAFLAFQDSDDYWFRRKLEKQMSLFDRARQSVGVVYCRMIRSGRDDVVVPGRFKRKTSDNIRKSLLKGNFVAMSAAVVRRECFATSGLFDERLPRLIDWEMWLRLSERYEFALLDEVLARATLTDDSISRNSEAYVTAARIIVEKHFSSPGDGRRVKAMGYYRLGKALCSAGCFSEGRECLLRAFKTFPFEPRSAAFAMLATPGERFYYSGQRAVMETLLRKKRV